MQKVNTFSKFLAVGILGVTLLNGAPVEAKTVVEWRGNGTHQEIPSMADGRPRLMLSYIDLLHNSISYEYIEDEGMGVAPWLVGVSWFNSEADLQDTSLMESISDFYQIGEAILGASMDDAVKTEIDNGITRYTFPMLNYNLENEDPTGKWGYFLRFLGGDNNLYWNGQADYTQCLIQYRDLRWGSDGDNLITGGCRGHYNANGVVSYELEYKMEGEQRDWGGVVEPDEPKEPIVEMSSDEKVEMAQISEPLEARTNQGETSNEVRIVRNANPGRIELVNTVVGNSEPEIKMDEGFVKSVSEEGEKKEIEVPELNGGGETEKGRVEWWMIATMGFLALGIIIWWLFPIVKRRKKDEDEE